MSGIATTIAIAGELEIPLSVRSLTDFREWVCSEEFPERGRIDYIQGRIEVDMSPEGFWFHAQPKTEVARVIANVVKARRLGYVGIDCTRFSSELGDISAEPDVVLVKSESLLSGKVRLSTAADSEDFVEIEGGPDLVVEVVSKSSVKKDMKRLPPAYFDAGIEEFWLIDVRPKKFLFQIHRRGKTKWKPAATRPDGSQHSTVLDRRYGLEQHAEPGGVWTYDLIGTM